MPQRSLCVQRSKTSVGHCSVSSGCILRTIRLQISHLGIQSLVRSNSLRFFCVSLSVLVVYTCTDCFHATYFERRLVKRRTLGRFAAIGRITYLSPFQITIHRYHETFSISSTLRQNRKFRSNLYQIEPGSTLSSQCYGSGSSTMMCTLVFPRRTYQLETSPCSIGQFKLLLTQ